MSVSLNLSHTFTTKVVYSSEQVKEVREGILAELAMAAKADLSKLEPKKRAQIKAGILLLTMVSTYSDEDMILFLTKEAMKDGLEETLRVETKELNVTRLSPLQTTVVSAKKPKLTCQGCTRTECTRPEGKAGTGCEEKTVGLRAPHFEQRFEKTV